MKKRLLLLLLPTGMGLVLWVSLAVDALFILFLPALILLPLSLGFALQTVALELFRQRLRWLRFASLVLLLIPTVWAVREASPPREMFWQLAAALLLAAAVFYLIGWGIAWAVERQSRV